LQQVPGTLNAIAAKVQASKPAVSTWRIGTRTPDIGARRRLWAAFEIPIEAWECVPGALEPAAELDGDQGDEDEDDAEDGDAAHEQSVLDHANRQLRILSKEIGKKGLTTRERIMLNEAYRKALADRARYLREQELLEDRVIREHPKWRALKAAIIAALVKHPAVAREVEAAIIATIGADA
jgi:transcriptional regulator with XRE-family HTH domain